MGAPSKGLADLPIELKLRVLSFLDQRDLCRVACVSREFRELSQDPCLWKRVAIEGDLDARVVARLLDRASMLEELSLRECSAVAPWADRGFDGLRTLDLGFSADVDAEAVTRFVERCPSLTHVNLEGCGEVDDAAVAVLCRLPQLTSLNLCQCRQVTDDGLVMIAREACSLRSLNVAGIDGTSDRSGLPTLCELARGLSDRLESLELDGEHSLSSLRHLTIRRGLWLGGDALASLFEGGSLRELVSLELGNMPLGDKGLKVLVDGCPFLEVLFLANCWDVTEDGLATIVARCRNLTDLDLRGLYKVTGSSLRKMPPCLPRLRRLGLERCCQVPDGLPSYLAGRVPGLMVYGFDGSLALARPDMEDPFVSEEEPEDTSERSQVYFIGGPPVCQCLLSP
ncbi:F-box/leucine rich repeat protein, putative [Ixodes scapularis]|uniref:F-box/leucine rich repeat protein, putative n=1 Tax=Ixodes scapularis TaxID=6945 RepID=B7Q6R3_IXOSC|nr:F-box/leucine rich repeat protein, putative [Ixodes scapularis]|eukprot:XP_002403278.1 F-box/leucine rich repeat protein, putative [Ixodes scapularis]